jgi:hypothetical protein
VFAREDKNKEILVIEFGSLRVVSKDPGFTKNNSNCFIIKLPVDYKVKVGDLLEITNEGWKIK